MIYSASYEDLPQIIEMCIEWSKESGKQDQVDIFTGGEYVVDRWKEAPILIYKDTDLGEIQGFVCLEFGQPWFNKKVFLTDYMWYIKPKYRGKKGIFKALVDAVKDLGKLNKMDIVLTFLSHGEKTDVKMKMFERHGFSIEGFIAHYEYGK